MSFISLSKGFLVMARNANYLVMRPNWGRLNCEETKNLESQFWMWMFVLDVDFRDGKTILLRDRLWTWTSCWDEIKTRGRPMLLFHVILTLTFIILMNPDSFIYFQIGSSKHLLLGELGVFTGRNHLSVADKQDKTWTMRQGLTTGHVSLKM